MKHIRIGEWEYPFELEASDNEHLLFRMTFECLDGRGVYIEANSLASARGHLLDEYADELPEFVRKRSRAHLRAVSALGSQGQ